MSPITTRAPASARTSAMPLPIPWAAPVTMATCPSKLKFAAIAQPPCLQSLKLRLQLGIYLSEAIVSNWRHTGSKSPEDSPSMYNHVQLITLAQLEHHMRELSLPPIVASRLLQCVKSICASRPGGCSCSKYTSLSGPFSARQSLIRFCNVRRCDLAEPARMTLVQPLKYRRRAEYPVHIRLELRLYSF